MNTYQRIAFGAFGLLALALIIGATYDLNGLKVAVVFMLLVALLTLKTTWKLMLSGVQLAGIVVGGVGHLVGIVGDEVSDWSKGRKVRLSSASQASNVPSWDSLQPTHVDDQAPSDSDELDVPPFMKGVLDRQNV